MATIKIRILLKGKLSIQRETFIGYPFNSALVIIQTCIFVVTEADGLTTVVVTPGSIFNNVVDCFEYIQLGSNFQKNFQTHQLPLDSTRLRLSRCGQSVRLSDDVTDGHSFHQAFASPTNSSHQAENILRQVLELLPTQRVHQ